MSSNPQWSTFQPPVMNTDSAILDFKSVLQPNSNSSSYVSAANGTTYGFYNHKESAGNGSSYGGSYGKSSSNYSSDYTSGNTYSGNSTAFSSYGNSSNAESSSSSYHSASMPYAPNSNKFPPIGVFNEGTAGANSSSNMYSEASTNGNSSNYSQSNCYSDNSSNSQGIRETGIIEKLLHSYGFIQCCERQARLFFHFSQFEGNIEHLKIGDPVEFEMTYDRRTGKPIASAVTKIGPEVIPQVLSEERVTGTVTTELRHEGNQGDLQGRISYENRGECFFLPYGPEDVEGNVTLRGGDKVSFQIATNQRSGNLAARHVRLENPAYPVRYQGVICSMKESFGFIERADVVKEIFFHFSEAKGLREDLKLGDDVEFTIQTRNGKEVACNITRLESGTVVFEDVDTEEMRGQVLKPIKKGQQWHQNDPLPGRIRYRGKDRSEVEIPYGEKDQKGEYTLKHGDWVAFCIATDRRDQLQRATKIILLDDSYVVSGEKREQGVIAVLKDGFGFLRCAERDVRLFFHFSEMVESERAICLDDEVEFTVVQDPTTPNRQSAIRIKNLSPGTVQFETIVQSNVQGVIIREAGNSWGPRTNGKASQVATNGEKPVQEAGLIQYHASAGGDARDNVETIVFYLKECELRHLPHMGDKVEFNICQVRHTKEMVAVNVRVVETHSTTSPQSASPPNDPVMNTSSNSAGNNPSSSNDSSATNVVEGELCQGFIAALKDGFGFIETAAHDKEIFFHFSTYEGDPVTLELGQEVEYVVSPKPTGSGRLSTDCVRGLSRGSIQMPTVGEVTYEGAVVRPVRSVNPDQNEYAGLVQVSAEGGDGQEYEFGITSLLNKREILQPGDAVQFQLDENGRAANVVALRKKQRAIVEAVKGQYGFLSHEMDGKKLFFHMTEVKDNVTLQHGDEVEFVVVTNQRSGKSSACSVVKLSNAQRPERLISRLRTVSADECGPRMLVIRQPKGPDGTKGFNHPRDVRLSEVIG